MASAKRDVNFVITLIALSMLDYETPVNIAINPLTGGIICEII